MLCAVDGEEMLDGSWEDFEGQVDFESQVDVGL